MICDQWKPEPSTPEHCGQVLPTVRTTRETFQIPASSSPLVLFPWSRSGPGICIFNEPQSVVNELTNTPLEHAEETGSNVGWFPSPSKRQIYGLGKNHEEHIGFFIGFTLSFCLPWYKVKSYRAWQFGSSPPTWPESSELEENTSQGDALLFPFTFY